jgi:glutaminyl-tRNA synthetase
VLDPIRVTIENFPAGQVEWIECVNNPEDAAAGTRKVPFTRTLYIEREDFREDPPKKYFRLSPGKEVRLRYAWCITCKEVKKDAAGRDRRARLHLRPADRPRPDRRRAQGQGHHPLGQRGARHRGARAALRPPVLGRVPRRRAEGVDWKSNLNPGSLLHVPHAKLEPS